MSRTSRIAAMVVVCGTSANLSAQVGEGFEHGNEALYAAQGSMVDNMTLNAAAAHSGAFGAQFDNTSNPGFRTRLDYPTAPGNRYFTRVRSRGGAAANSGRVYFGVGASAGGAFSAVFAPNTGAIILQDNAGWSFSELATAAFVPAADTWYVLMLTWANNGDMTVSIWDDAMVNQLAATAPVATGFTTPGGISFRGFSFSATIFSDVDEVGRSNTGACCLPDGSCVVRTSETCLASNGIYSGDFSSCAAAACAKAYAYSGASVAIPDGTASTVCGTEVFAQVTVPDNFPIANAEASYFMTHTFQGDLVVTLEKVGGPSVVLVDRPGVPPPAGFSSDNYGANSANAGRFISTGAGTITENFENANESIWIDTNTGGDNMTINAAGAENGSFGAQFDTSTGSSFRFREDLLSAPGNRYVAHVRSGGAGGGRSYFGVSASAAGAFSAVFAPNTSEIRLQDNAGWGFNELAAAPFAPVIGTWYSLVLDWAANGDMTVSVWDEHMTAQIAATPTIATGNLKPGGFSLRGFANTGGTQDVDDIGTVARIYDAPATTGFNNPTGRWQTENSMNTFVGVNSQGNWRLRVRDCAGLDTGSIVAFTLLLKGPAAGATCYANCDNSTNPPCLNVNDFVCFNNAYSAASPYANCDGSTIVPILNVNDFVCFNNKYSAGCASPCAPH